MSNLDNCHKTWFLLITHSHQYHYSNRINSLFEKGKKLNCDIVCFGHTHTPYIENREGVWLVNPGSLLYNRDGSKIGYVVIETNNGKIKDIERKPLVI